MRGFVSRFVRHRPAVLGLLLLLAVVLAALLAPVLYPASPFELVGRPFQPPFGQYPLGTDMLGRDLAAGVLHGARTTLLVGLVATVFAVLVGVSVGGLAGYFGGRVDALLMRLTEIFQTIPFFLFAILIEAIAFFGLGAYQGLHKFFVEAIQRMELEEMAHEGRLVAERTRQLALAEEEIALIALRTAESRARTEAMMAGQEGETFDAIRAAERNLKRAEANALISDILRRAHEAEVGPVASVPPRPIWVEPAPVIETPIETPVSITEPEPLELTEPAPPPEMTPAQRRARAGGLGNAQARAAEKAKSERLILVPSFVARDAMKRAAE